MTDELRENLSDVMHDIWSNWMVRLFNVAIQNDDGTYTIPADYVERWQRQIKTPYAQLSEEEKDSDREQIDRVLEVLNGHQPQ